MLKLSATNCFWERLKFDRKLLERCGFGSGYYLTGKQSKHNSWLVISCSLADRVLALPGSLTTRPEFRLSTSEGAL